MSIDYRLDTDLDEAYAMAENLEEYVRGTELYGHSGGGMFSRMPSLTVGALVMRLRRLQHLAHEMSDANKQKLGRTVALHEHVQQEWTVHYTEKAHREMLSRLDAMMTFFRECNDSPKQCANIYKPEASRRTIVQELALLLESMNEDVPEGYKAKVYGIDNQLRAILEPAPFIWADILADVYSSEMFWWLYRLPAIVEDEK